MQHVVAAPPIGTGEAINVPTVRYVVAAPTRSSGSTVQDTHVLTTGAVTLEGATLASGSTVQDAHIVANAGSTKLRILQIRVVLGGLAQFDRDYVRTLWASISVGAQ